MDPNTWQWKSAGSTLELRQLRGSISNTRPAADSSWCKTPGGEKAPGSGTVGDGRWQWNMRTFLCFFSSRVFDQKLGIHPYTYLKKNIGKITTWRWVLEYMLHKPLTNLRYRSSGSSNTRFFHRALHRAIHAVVQCIFPSSHLSIP